MGELGQMEAKKLNLKAKRGREGVEQEGDGEGES